MPDLSDGHCVTGRANLTAEHWTGPSTPSMRELAVIACSGCPVLSECREWALTGLVLPAWPGAEIVAGLTVREIRQIRGEADDGGVTCTPAVQPEIAAYYQALGRAGHFRH